jgi:hypothetical protein
MIKSINTNLIDSLWIKLKKAYTNTETAKASSQVSGEVKINKSNPMHDKIKGRKTVLMNIILYG